MFLTWHPDGTQLAFCTCEDMYCAGGSLWLVDTISLSVEQVHHHTQRCGVLSWSPDGSWLADYAGEFGYSGVLFYQTGGWQITRRLSSVPIWGGSWAGNEFFLGDEALRDNRGGIVGHQLVSISVEGPEKYILWNPEDVGLPERIKGKLGFNEIAWYVPVQP